MLLVVGTHGAWSHCQCLILNTIRSTNMLTSNLDDIGCISILGAATIIS